LTADKKVGSKESADPENSGCYEVPDGLRKDVMPTSLNAI
jgi:hypothetical protein